ncbi:exosporium protein E [Bacillus sp. DX4.1]|uniref:exosporium protein E n=1 Tax=Bacillus sp. DX4.1 TaxID=3055867 RepID=UPI0025A2C6B7|nr:exosporium protein E [Bacillus sp. DX4.1]MDM5188038.1 exosporium protein E [Bacillus sp. DX4.1]
MIFSILQHQEDAQDVTQEVFVKYDIFSIFFIGVLGTIGITLYFLLSTGLLEEIRYSVSASEQTNDIPEVQRSIPDTITKVVVDTSNMPLTIEGTQSSELRLFGTYQVAMDKQEKNKLKQEDFVSIRMIDQTMYVTLKPLPITSKFFVSEPKITATLTLPQNIDVEIRESQRDITLYPGQLQSNWSIQGKSSVSVYLAKDSDMTLSAVTNKKELQGNMPWEYIEELNKNEDTHSREEQNEEQHEKWYTGTLKFGNGTHHLNVLHAYNLDVNVLEK